MLTRRRLLQISAVAGGLGAGLGLYTWRWEPHWLEVVERPLPVASLPEPLLGSRIVQLSDLHIGPQVDDAYLIHTFDRVKDLSPEIVVYTGDFITYDGDFVEHVRRAFAHLPRGKQATLGVLGNHDYGPGWSDPDVADRIVEIAGAAGLRILRNETAELAGLQIVGVDDLWAGRFAPEKARAGLKPGAAALVLSHNPDTADQAGWGDYQGWILSGHTHGGQCKPPFLPPPLLPVKNRRYTSGEFLLAGNRRMYVNRGVGYLLRVRFNARPEVTVFRLTRA